MQSAFKKTVLSALVLSLLAAPAAEACSSFIIGKKLTTDGSVLYGRTEDYPFLPQPGAHNKNYIVTPAKDYPAGSELKDRSTGFTYPHLAHEFKYTSVPDASRDTDEGVYGAHGQNEYGVTMTATTSATPHDKILAIDPLVKNGLAEAALVDLVLPRVKSAREGIELVAKVLDEKGSAEGNIIVIADKNELWYMEILSGHQYAAIKYPDDKYSIYPNTFFMGNPYELGKGNYIVSKDLETVARKANHYRESKIGYFDHHFELLQSPSNPNQKYSLADAIAIQRNRFETLKEGFIPDDQYDKRGADGRPEVKAAYDGDTYKFAPGNENVIDAHIYQIKPDLPASMASILWLSNAPSRNTPYIPFYGTVTDTHPSFKPQDFTYNPNSFYWVAWHIDQMVMQNQNLFGSSIKQKWMALEKREEAEQRARDAKYRGKTDAQAAALSGEVTRDAIARTEKLFQEMKAVEKQMMQTIKAKGGKDDSIAVLQQKFDKQKADTVKTENASEGVTAK